MSDFDPYLKWLGIRDPLRPPNHYRLLGIEPFESDSDVIAAAADRQMSHLRKYQQGQHAELSQRLLNEVATAKLCLLKAEARQTYDAQLRSTQGAATANRGPIQINTWPGVPGPRREVRRFRRQLAAAALVAFLTAALAGGWWLWSIERERRLADGQELGHSQPQPADVAVADDRVPIKGPLSRPGDEAQNRSAGEIKATTVPAVAESQPMSSPVTRPATKIDGTDLAPWDLPVTIPAGSNADLPAFALPVYAALADRDAAIARRELVRLNNAANDQKQLELLEKLTLVVREVDVFWRAFERGLSELRVGQSIDFRGVSVSLTAKSDREIELLTAGGRKRSFSVDPAKVPLELALAITESHATPLCMAAAVTAITQTTDGLAQPYLRQATAAGLPAALIASAYEHPSAAGQFESMPPSPQGTPSQKTLPGFALATGGSATGVLAPEEGAKQAIPPAERQAKARTLIESIFGDKSSRGDRATRVAANRAMLVQSLKTDQDPTAKYVMLSEARKRAANLGDISSAWTALDALDSEYDVDSGALGDDTISELNRRVKASGEVHQLFLNARDFLDHLLDGLRLDAAQKLAPGMLTLSRRTGDSEIMQTFAGLPAEIGGMREAHTRVQPAYEKLRSDAGDSEANAQVGNFLAFVVGDVDQALPFLARSAEAKDLELSQRMLADDEPDIDGIDAWWNRADSLTGYCAVRVREFAVAHYKSLLPELERVIRERLGGPVDDAVFEALNQPQRLKIERRIAEFDRLYAPRRSLADILADHLWTVRWSSGSVWENVEFGPNEECRIKTSSGKSAMNWRVVRSNMVVIRPQSGGGNYVVQMDGRKLFWAKIDETSGRQLLSGVSVQK